MLDLFVIRGVERVLIIVGAIFFGYLGYKLYLHGITSSRSQVDFDSKFMKFAVSGTGPGLLFMVFGAIVLVFSLVFGRVSSKETLTSEEASKSSVTGLTTPPLGGQEVAAPMSESQPQNINPVRSKDKAEASTTKNEPSIEPIGSTVTKESMKRSVREIEKKEEKKGM